MNERKLTDKELQEFFSGLADRISIAASYEKRIARFEAPRFNVFEFIEPNEAKVTAILADILDPNGSHGQGDAFLRSFLSAVGFIGPSSDEIASAVVRLEDSTRWKRRIDLTITMGRHIIGLENKIDAGEQTAQVGDYMKELSWAAKGSWLLIFLTKKGGDPGSCEESEWAAAQRDNKALAISYAELSTWLRSCVSASSSDRVRGFIHDMATWTKNLRGGTMASDLRELIILDFFTNEDNKRYLETLLTLQDTSDAVRRGLIMPFAKHLETKITEQFQQPKWIVSSRISKSDLGGKSPGILIRKTTWPGDCQIGIEADRLDKNFGYGIYWPSAPKDAKEEVRSELKKKFGEGRSSSTWPWWADVPTFHNGGVRWGESYTIMLMLGERREELINEFVGQFIELDKIVSPILDRLADLPTKA